MNRHALSENVFDFVSSATCSRLLDYAGLMHAGFVVPSQPFEFALRQNILDTLGWLSGLNQKLVKRRSPFFFSGHCVVEEVPKRTIRECQLRVTAVLSSSKRGFQRIVTTGEAAKTAEQYEHLILAVDLVSGFPPNYFFFTSFLRTTSSPTKMPLPCREESAPAYPRADKPKTNVVRLGNAPVPDPGCDLAQTLLVDSGQDDRCGRRSTGYDIRGKIDDDGVSVAQLEVESLRGAGRRGGEGRRK